MSHLFNLAWEVCCAALAANESLSLTHVGGRSVKDYVDMFGNHHSDDGNNDAYLVPRMPFGDERDKRACFVSAGQGLGRFPHPNLSRETESACLSDVLSGPHQLLRVATFHSLPKGVALPAV